MAQNYIIQLVGVGGRRDDPDVKFKQFIGPGSISAIFKWLRENGFVDQSGPYWERKDSKGFFFEESSISSVLVHKIQAEVIPLKDLGGTRASSLDK